MLITLYSVLQIIQCISETFGRSIWRNTLLVLTHGNMTMPPPGTTFGKWVPRCVRGGGGGGGGTR